MQPPGRPARGGSGMGSHLQLPCLKCRITLRVPAGQVGHWIKCPQCNLAFVASSPPPLPSSDSLAPADTSGPFRQFLDECETLLTRMIIGIFRFSFVRLPCWIYESTLQFAPTLVKAIRVLVLMAVWLLVAVVPAVIGLCFSWSM